MSISGEKAHEKTLIRRRHPAHEGAKLRASSVVSRNILFRFNRL